MKKQILFQRDKNLKLIQGTNQKINLEDKKMEKIIEESEEEESLGSALGLPDLGLPVFEAPNFDFEL